MTAGAASYYRCMVDNCVAPAGRGMARIAVATAIDVSCAFAGGSAPVMARRAGPSNAAVIEAHICPVAGGMASIATAAGDDMCRGLARGGYTVMTTGATAHHIVMVDSDRR